jgi:hypothetical protein
VADRYDRLNRWIDHLQGNPPGEALPPADATEAELFWLAAALSALRPGAAEPDPAFLARLGATLQKGPPRPRWGRAERWAAADPGPH